MSASEDTNNVELVSYIPNESPAPPSYNEADTTDDSDKPSEEITPNDQSRDHTENAPAVTAAEHDAAVNDGVVGLEHNTENNDLPITEADTTDDSDKPSEEITPNDESRDHTENSPAVTAAEHDAAVNNGDVGLDHAENKATVIVQENNGVVKFVPDGDAGTVDGAAGRNGPSTVAPSTSADDKENAKKEKPKIVGFFELFRFATKWDVALMIIGAICAIAHGVAMPLLIVFFGDMVDSFIQYGTTAYKSNFTLAGYQDTLNSETRRVSIIFVGIGAAVLVIGYIRVEAWLQASYRQIYFIRLALLQAVLRQEIGWFDTNDPGELGSRLSDDVNKIREGIGDKLGSVLHWTSTFISGLTFALVYGWKLALVVIAVSPLLVVCGAFMTRLLTSASTKELAAYAKAGSVAEEVLSSMRTVVAFGGQEKECVRYSKNLKQAKDFGIQKGLIAGGGMGMFYFITFAVYALAFWYGGKLVREEDYTPGRMLTVFFCIVIGAFSIGAAAPNLESIGVARGAAYMIWNLIDRKSMIDSSSDEGLKPDDMNGTIELKNVTFRYPSREEVPVLNGLNMRADKGQTVALVGASGCGKSTVVQLIQRFYDPLEGSIEIDGVDIRQLNVKWLRNKIGVVSQEPVLFAKTIAENIRYGRDGITQQDIEKAAIDANAYDFISELPNKYETLVGERGAQLSGGQKQRIAIARALVRDPKILLLDEATSALDTESEATVQAALDKACMGRTTIIIAHRLSTIKNANLIYGLQDGVVHEFGTHDELMLAGGIYYQLVTNQQTMDEMGDILEEHPREKAVASPQRSLSAKRRSSASRKVDVLPDGSVVETKEEEKLTDPSLKRLIKLNASEWYFIVIGCIMALAQGAVQPAFALIFGTMLGVFSKPPNEQEDEIFFYSMMFLVLAGGSAITMLVMGWMFAVSGERLTMRLRQMAFKALLRQEIAYFDDHSNTTGALTTRLSTEASAVQGATGSRLATVIQSCSSIGTGIIIAFIYSWEFALFIIGIAPFFFLAGFVEMKIMTGLSGSEALEGAGQVANEAIVNIRTVASLSKEPKFLDDYKDLIGVPLKKNLRNAHGSAILFGISQSLIFFSYAAIFTFGAWLILNRDLPFDDMFKAFGAIVFGAMAVGQASQFAPDYGKAKAAAAKIFALLDKQPTIDSFCTDGEKLESCSGKIDFTDVHFSYPTRSSVNVFHGLDLSVDEGQTVALVGKSGCGKSTTVQLLERFYDPTAGHIMVSGHDIQDLGIQWLRSQVGLVSQEPVLFDCSIRENIEYGDNSRQVTMDEVIEAARKANIHTFVDSLPLKYDTNVGDKGTQLSGGQKQRVAIARALVRNPKILLLDEATSALDTESEKVVQDALDQAQIGRTCVVIAHRLSTVQNADKIIVIHNGNVAEQGTHSELIARNGIYHKLHMAQSRKK